MMRPWAIAIETLRKRKKFPKLRFEELGVFKRQAYDQLTKDTQNAGIETIESVVLAMGYTMDDWFKLYIEAKENEIPLLKQVNAKEGAKGRASPKPKASSARGKTGS